MVAVAIYLLACWFGRPQKAGTRRKDIEKLTAALRRIREQIRSGKVDWRPVEIKHDLPAPMINVIETAWLEGKPISKSLESMAHQLSVGGTLAHEQFDLMRLYWSRSGLVGLVALGAGLFRYDDARVFTDIREQLISGTLAACVYFAGFSLIKNATALPWVAHFETQNEKVSTWLATHIHGETSSTSDWASAIDELTAREFSQGVSLLAEKRLLLEDWSEDQFRVLRQRLTLVADLMPLGEIIGLGVPLILLLFHGVSQFI